jgi:hemerythrin-like domain-containing protein
MNSIILKELLTNASRHKGEPLPATIKIIVNYVKEMEDKDFHHASDKCKTALKDEKARSKWLKESNDELDYLVREMEKDTIKSAKYIRELEARIDELEEENDNLEEKAKDIADPYRHCKR